MSTNGAALPRRFADRFEASFPLVASADEAIVQANGVWREKKNYGKAYWGAPGAPRF